MAGTDADIYGAAVGARLPRLLGLYDLDPTSATYGLGDREHWGWKVKDFNNLALQGGALTLATSIASGRLPRTPRLLEFVRAILAAGGRVLHPDGSGDEAFPQERSWCATATFAFQVARTLEVLGNDLPDAGAARDLLRRLSAFVARNEETHGVISNHLAAAAAALAMTPGHEADADRLLDRILARQSPDGWYREYDGPDPGYQTLCTYYLAELLRVRPSPRLEDSLRRSLDVLAWAVHPDGTFGGEYGSRNTEVYYPAGLEMLAPSIPAAAAIAARMRRALAEGRSVAPEAVDAGNFVVLLETYARAAETARPLLDAPPVPCEGPEAERWCADAGLLFRTSKRYYAVVNARKGGLCKVFRRPDGARLWDDGGYVGTLAGGDVVTTQIFDPEAEPVYAPGCLRLKARFCRARRRAMTPFLMAALRLLSLTFLRWKAFAAWLKKRMVRSLMTEREGVDAVLEREILFEDERVRLRDRVTAGPGARFRELRFGLKFAAIHMASSKYPHAHFLEPAAQGPVAADVERLSREGALETETVVAP